MPSKEHPSIPIMALMAWRYDSRRPSCLVTVISHGSSGYARSVLLIFDPKGRLVWQEELNKLRAILAAPDDDHGEVLLVGGMDGILEYRLDGRAAPVQ